jgi:hypothetical protein
MAIVIFKVSEDFFVNFSNSGYISRHNECVYYGALMPITMPSAELAEKLLRDVWDAFTSSQPVVKLDYKNYTEKGKKK